MKFCMINYMEEERHTFMIKTKKLVTFIIFELFFTENAILLSVFDMIIASNNTLKYYLSYTAQE